MRVTTWNTQLSTIKWTYTATNRLLFEAGVAPGASPDTIIAEPDRINGISIQEQGSPVGSALGIRPLIYRAPQGFDFDDRLPSQSCGVGELRNRHAQHQDRHGHAARPLLAR